MVFTGAVRSFIVKSAYQTGFEAPLTVTILYLTGQSLSIFVYLIQTHGHCFKIILQNFGGYYYYSFPKDDSISSTTTTTNTTSYNSSDAEYDDDPDNDAQCSRKNKNGNSHALHDQQTHQQNHDNKVESPERKKQKSHSQHFEDNPNITHISSSLFQTSSSSSSSSSNNNNNNNTLPKGSRHGLTTQSQEAIKWTQTIPWYYKPIIPGIFNLLNSTLRWASLVYVAASMSEMLISGMELTLSVIAARFIRKRMVSRARWLGVGFVVLGMVLIGLFDYYLIASKEQVVAVAVVVHDDNNHDDNDDFVSSSTSTNTSSTDNWTADHEQEEDQERRYAKVTNQHSQQDSIIGIILIILQCIFSVLQDIAEEIFMQDEHDTFPPSLLLGMEGSFGLIFGVILYFVLGEQFGETPNDVWKLIQDDPSLAWWIVALPFLFLVSAIFNITATQVTSSMTRNVWKNLRTALVWVMSLLMYYTTDGDSNIGEPWYIPESFYVLGGFSIMVFGIIVYYWQKKMEDEQSTFQSVHQDEEEDASQPLPQKVSNDSLLVESHSKEVIKRNSDKESDIEMTGINIASLS